MRRIERTTQFRKDYKREMKGPHRKGLAVEFPKIIGSLANDEILPARHRDHALAGAWSDQRDCHVRPDLVLIDRKPDPETLQLVRIGSHSELGL
jgi:mRNA interferase YafQ